MASNITMIKKLQRAINNRGERILYMTSQFYSDDEDRPITLYSIKKAVLDEKKGRNVNVELFKSTSQIQIVLFLRDYWYQLNGLEVPRDNEKWEEVKRKYKEHNG